MHYCRKNWKLRFGTSDDIDVMIYSSVNKPWLTSVKLMTPPSGRHLVWALLNHSILSSVTCLSFFQIEPMCWLSSSVLFQEILFRLSPIYEWCLCNSVAPCRHLQHLRSASRALQLNLCHACKEDIVLFDNSPVTCQVDLLPLGWTHLPSVAWNFVLTWSLGCHPRESVLLSAFDSVAVTEGEHCDLRWIMDQIRQKSVGH